MAKVKLHHVTKSSLDLLFVVHFFPYKNKKFYASFTHKNMDSFYLLIFYFNKSSTWIWLVISMTLTNFGPHKNKH